MKSMSKAPFLRLPLLPVLILLLAAARPIQAGPNDANPGAGQLPSAHEANGGPGPSSQLNEPIAIPEAQWDVPSNTLAQIDFTDMLATDVATRLRDQFSNQLDVVAPGEVFNEANRDDVINLHLRNVSITEVFNALNLVFITERSPMRWQLMMNGKRPTALLRVLEVPKPPVPPPELTPPPPPEQPMVFFVGDLLGDPKSGGMTMDQLVKTVEQVSSLGIGGDHVFGHLEAQLIVVKGTGSDIGFVRNTLEALRQKAQLEAQRRGSVAPAVKSSVGLSPSRAGAPPSGSTAAPEVKTH